MQKGKELQACCKLLSGDDTDGASERNNIGWNKFDSRIGHQYAELDQTKWTDDDARMIFRMLKKYRKQLISLGVDWTAIDLEYSYLTPY